MRRELGVTDVESCAQHSAGNDERLRRAVSDDQNAYYELFEECRPELLRYVSPKMGDLSDDPDDVVQAIYEPVFKGIQGKDPNKDLILIAYLKKAAWNEILRLKGVANTKFPLSDDQDVFEEGLSAWNAWDQFEDEWAKDERDSRNKEIRKASEAGDEKRLGELRNEFRRRYREVDKPDE